MSSSGSRKVIVGITTRNRASLLPKAIQSALAQSHRDIEIAVIDDGSTDGTPAIKDHFPTVRWLRHEASLGIIQSRNELMRSAADFYVSLDDDAWFLQGDEIALALAHLETHPNLAGVAFDILSPDQPEKRPRAEAQSRSMFIGCGHMLRLSMVRQAGFYAPTPGAYGSEEKDLCLRLADLGHAIALLPGVHVWHEKAWSDRDNRPLHRSGVCNEMIMTLRRCPMPELLAVLPLKTLSYLWFWLRNPFYFISGIRGLADFLRHLPSACGTRSPVKRETFRRFSRQPK